MNYSKLKSSNYLVFAFVTMFAFIFLGCKSGDEIDPNAAYVNIPDVNFEKTLIKLNRDTIQDGKVRKANLTTINELQLSGINKNPADKIQSLVGVEAMSNLTILDCGSNSISNLDVSKNLALKSLTCSDNKISIIDVSNLTSLDYLVCGVNLLTVLDVSKNKALKLFACQGNKLTALDVTQNKLLDFLNCNENKFTVLDVSQNTNLTYLDCSINNLTSLDIKKNTLISFLRSFKNNIQTICVSSLSQVKSNWEKDLSATYKVCP